MLFRSLYRGSVVEAGDAGTVIRSPQHPYTRLLVDSIPWPDLDIPWGGAQPVVRDEMAVAAQGCTFAPRCPQAMARCRAEAPGLFCPAPRQVARCFLHDRAPRHAESRLSDLLQTAASETMEPTS